MTQFPVPARFTAYAYPDAENRFWAITQYQYNITINNLRRYIMQQCVYPDIKPLVGLEGPQPFNSHKWPRQNFSLQYQYNIKQTSDENKEKYQLGDYKLIQYQILQTNITRTVWETVRRITNEILGVKGLKRQSCPRLHLVHFYNQYSCSLYSLRILLILIKASQCVTFQ